MYWVQGKTWKANPVKKSLEDSKPATMLTSKDTRYSDRKLVGKARGLLLLHHCLRLT